MKPVKPVVIKIGETVVNPEAMRAAMASIGVSQEAQDRFMASRGRDGQALIDFAGRICYESYEPGLNPNVMRSRVDPADYYKHIMMKGEGSIQDHDYTHC